MKKRKKTTLPVIRFQHQPNAADILQVCAEILGTTFTSLASRNLTRRDADNLKIAAVELRRAGYSSMETGQILGGRDHSTILSHCGKYDDYMDTEPQFRVRAQSVSAAVAAVFAPDDIEI